MIFEARPEIVFVDSSNSEDILPKINQLFLTVFGKRRTPEDWSRKYFSNPHGESILLAALQNELVIGFYGLIPRKIQFHKSCLKAYQDVDVMIHPDYKKGALFKNMGESIYQKARASGADFTFGFPNQTSLPAGRRLLRWRSIGYLPLWSLYFNPIGFFLSKIRNQCFQEKKPSGSAASSSQNFTTSHSEGIFVGCSFNERWIPLIESQPVPHQFFGTRDSQYMRYRYGNSDFIFIHKEHNSFISSAAVVAFPNCSHEAVITDIFYDTNHFKAFRDIIQACVKEASCRNCNVLRMWNFRHSEISPWLRRLHFLERNSSLFLVIHSFRPPEFNRLLWDPAFWRISAGDSDCY